MGGEVVYPSLNTGFLSPPLLGFSLLFFLRAARGSTFAGASSVLVVKKDKGRKERKRK